MGILPVLWYSEGKMPPKLSYAGLGSNLGDKAANLAAAVRLLQEQGDIRILRQSKVLHTKPLAGMDQPDYLNSVIELDTALDAETLISRFLMIEEQMGRSRTSRWAPRPIDIDLLLCGNDIIKRPNAVVPHPQMHLRSFVMQGMKELAPDTAHPVLRQTMAVLADRLGGGDFFLDASRPQLVSIAGMIGVGKTTLAGGLAAELGCPVVREAYDTNPFLARVYAGEKGLALDSQIYFLTSRADQLGPALTPGKPFVSDYAFEQEKVFAHRWLDPMQLALYMKVNACISEKVHGPVLTIYLHDTIKRCLDRIHARGRVYEQKMDEGFLLRFQDEYEKMFAHWTTSPLIRVDAGQVDCRQPDLVNSLAREVRAYLALG
jgi:deoxyguanosine kinase